MRKLKTKKNQNSKEGLNDLELNDKHKDVKRDQQIKKYFTEMF